MGQAKALLTRRQRGQRRIIAADALCWTLRMMLTDPSLHFDGAEAPASIWLAALTLKSTERSRLSPQFPKHPAQAGRRFAELSQAGSLEQFFGIYLTFRRKGSARLWKIETTARRHLVQEQADRESDAKAREREKKRSMRAAKAQTMLWPRATWTETAKIVPNASEAPEAAKQQGTHEEPTEASKEGNSRGNASY